MNILHYIFSRLMGKSTSVPVSPAAAAAGWGGDPSVMDYSSHDKGDSLYSNINHMTEDMKKKNMIKTRSFVEVRGKRVSSATLNVGDIITSGSDGCGNTNIKTRKLTPRPK